MPDPAFHAQRVLAFRGALLLVFGLCQGSLLLFAFRLPGVTGWVLTVVFAGFLLGDGAAELVEGVDALCRREAWSRAVLSALAGLAAGVLTLLVASRPLRLFAWWAIVTGVLDGVAARSWRAGALAQVVVAVASLGIGVLILLDPLHDVPRLALWTCLYGVVFGLVRVAAAVHGARAQSA